MCVCVCQCMCVFVSAGRCAAGRGGGYEVTSVVVQMSPQPAEPHEWKLL